MSEEKENPKGANKGAKEVKKKKAPEESVTLPPGFWLFLLALPVFSVLVTYVFRDGPLPKIKTESPAQSELIAKDSRTLSRIIHSPQRVTRPPPLEKISIARLKACDFEDWIGKPLKKAVLKRHLLPHRVIVAGYEVKPTGNPLALSIEVNENLIVTKVWCG